MPQKYFLAKGCDFGVRFFIRGRSLDYHKYNAAPQKQNRQQNSEPMKELVGTTTGFGQLLATGFAAKAAEASVFLLEQDYRNK